MSSYGLREDLYVATNVEAAAASTEQNRPNLPTKHAQTQTQSSNAPTRSQLSRSNATQTDSPRQEEDRRTPTKIQFAEFAEQLRQQQYFENRRRLLKNRKRVLQKSITLSARLHRVSSWIRDGLVEISKHSDAASFVRVHQHMQNLIDSSYSQWNHELHTLDPLEKVTLPHTDAAGSPDILTKLSSGAQADLFDLLSYLRSNPRFLVERFKVLAHSQIVSLSTFPRFSGVAQSEYGSFSYTRDRLSHKRIQSYSRALEDYAFSFERSNPLSFLLFNMYGTNQSSIDAENQLRLSTWSTVCADLMLTFERAYQALLPQLLNSFASLYEWRARDSVEMFLMDVLQRGAFLLDLVGDNRTSRIRGDYDPLDTPEAQEFFNHAVRDLFAIFVRYDGGFPTGALQFASAVLDKLPLIEQQSRFRGEFFSDWFIDHFLCLTITYPENENMLLKFHVSKNARDHILYQLWARIRASIANVYSEHPSQPVDPDFRYYVEVMVGTLDKVETANPYKKNDSTSLDVETEETTEASITVCLPEIVQVLEALSPQAMHSAGAYDPIVKSSTSMFYAQYAHASGRFDRLKRELILLLEPGSSTSEVHPCHEQWLQIEIDTTGRPRPSTKAVPRADDFLEQEGESLDAAQSAALRLYADQSSDTASMSGTSYRTDLLNSPSLETLFQKMFLYTEALPDPIGCIYWENAINTLHEKYPRSTLIKDDSSVLRSVYLRSKKAQSRNRECSSRLEIQLSVMEDMWSKIRATINKCVERFESLRLKIWYSCDVALSKHYDDAKNISKALNNMAISIVRNARSTRSPSLMSGRPQSTRSTTSSMFEQPYEDIMSMLKASSNHGGPKKLADKQIELTKTWLQRNNIDNFCRGEERIHRFCMEVFTVSRNLVGETLSESPVLWASELFARERREYDVRAYGVTSAPASTRPSSIFSDSMSTTYRSTRPVLRSAESLRMVLLDDRQSNSSSRINRDFLPPELASSISSPGRTYSATTAESISSVFSPLASNTRSLTSASIHSRSGSVYNDSGLGHFTDTTKEKTKFLEKVQQVLICLLLSDLGCPVWSLGSETDAMLDKSRSTSSVDVRLKQRMVAEDLIDGRRRKNNRSIRSAHRSRSQSVAARLTNPQNTSISDVKVHAIESQETHNDVSQGHLEDLSDILRKLSQQVDPIEKLAVAEEFHTLSLSRYQHECPADTCSVNDQSSSTLCLRRCSLDSRIPRPRQQQSLSERRDCKVWKNADKLTEDEIVQQLKVNIAKLRPKTLFRDLQYISAFVPSEITDKTPRGKALLHLGLAALAYKDEVCRSMVDVADKTFAQNTRSDFTPQMMGKVAEFWMSAAREGNAVAQRELALLYLSQPEILPIMSLPLSVSFNTFGNDMLWRERDYRNTNTQALCLALHWMQQAALNGDRIAQKKLEERKGGVSIR